MKLIEMLLMRANAKKFDVEIKDNTVTFKQKKYKKAWNTYVMPNRKCLILALWQLARNEPPHYNSIIKTGA